MNNFAQVSYFANLRQSMSNRTIDRSMTCAFNMFKEFSISNMLLVYSIALVNCIWKVETRTFGGKCDPGFKSYRQFFSCLLGNTGLQITIYF